MIKRIKVRNFLSLRDVDVELRGLNVLVGPNMSGKSNLIECLKFLQDAVGRPTGNETTALQEALSKRGGFAELAWKGQPEGPISFLLSAELAGPAESKVQSYCYEFSLRRHREYGHPEVEMEKLVVRNDGKEGTIFENCAGKLKIVDRGTVKEQPPDPFNLALYQFGQSRSTDAGRFGEFLSRWRFYHLVPALMRRSNLPSWEKFLFEQGDNLSAWLLSLQNYPETFRRIRQVCCDVLPGLGDLLFQPVEAPSAPVESRPGVAWGVITQSGKISVGTSEGNFRGPISLARMSDGELAFLGLISIILAPEELTPALLCIEEPENYLHPRLIEVFLELVNQRASEPRPPQVLATTHSLALVDKLTIDDLIVVDKKNGATRFARPSSKKRLRELLSRKETSLGDLWYSGALSDS